MQTIRALTIAFRIFYAGANTILQIQIFYASANIPANARHCMLAIRRFVNGSPIYVRRDLLRRNSFAIYFRDLNTIHSPRERCNLASSIKKKEVGRGRNAPHSAYADYLVWLIATAYRSTFQRQCSRKSLSKSNPYLLPTLLLAW